MSTSVIHLSERRKTESGTHSPTVGRPLRELVVATADSGLVRTLAARVLREEYGVLVLSEVDELRRRALASEGITLVDGRASELMRAVGLTPSRGDDARLFAVSFEGARGDVRSFSRDDLDGAIAWTADLAPVRRRDAADVILGFSSVAAKIRTQVRTVAAFADVSVLILGETGTGKELVAKSIHDLTFGEGAPFMAVNCAALPDHLVESELFGHAAGAFTGAAGSRVGLMEAAGRGTLFLDEVGEMAPDAQSALLRALESRTFRRVGSNRDLPLRARIVAATNRLSRADRVRLRRDLYFRLAGVTIPTAPLRERAVDIPYLTLSFLRDFSRRYGRSPVEVEAAALDRLVAHPWHGNIRELQAVVVHAAILAGGHELAARHVCTVLETRLDMPSAEAASHEPPRVSAEASPQRLPAVERAMIVRALDECGGNVSRAARVLGIPRSTLRDKLQKYALR